jgi:hypothetical protein
MKHIKLAVCLIAVSVMAGLTTPTPAAPNKSDVHIYAAFPNATDLHEVGTFVVTGALTLSGIAVMDVGPNQNGMIAHCTVVLTPDDGSGTIVIDQECQFATNPSKGHWQIVSGTGAYADLKGNGSLLMPGNDEDMTGTIY